MKKSALIWLCPWLISSACSLGSNEDQAQVEIPLPSMAEFMAARDQAFGKLRSASTIEQIYGPKFEFAVVNASGPGVQDLSFVVPSNSDKTLPTSIRIPRTIPFGRDRLFQILFVFDENGLELWYGDANLDIGSPNTAVDLMISPAHSRTLQLTQLKGRFFIPATQKPANGIANISFTPPQGSDGLPRRVMNLFRIPLVDGWGELFLFDSINLSARLETGEWLFENVNSSSSYALPQESVAEIVIPPAAFRGSSPENSSTFGDGESQEKTRYGYFGSTAGAQSICLGGSTALPLTTDLLGQGPRSLFSSQAPMTSPMVWAPFSSPSVDQVVALGGFRENGCSLPPNGAFRQGLQFDSRSFILQGPKSAFRFQSIFQILNGTEFNAIYSDFPRPLHMELHQSQLKMDWRLLYPELSQFISGYDAFVINSGTFYQQVRDQFSGPGANPCQDLRLRQAANPSDFLRPPVSIPSSSSSWSIPLSQSELTSFGGMVVLCPKSLTQPSSYLAGFEVASNNLGSGVGGGMSPVGLPDFVMVSAGGEHTCGIKSDQKLYCWGKNLAGNLGIGDSSPTRVETAPIAVDSMTNYAQVSASSSHTCAITTGQQIKCWGSNSSGQLGDGTTTSRNSPVLIDSSTTYTQISTGFNHTCGITTSRFLKCWGGNSNSQLGDGTTMQRDLPFLVDDSGSYTQVSAGTNYTCGITTASTGNLKCWGTQTNGALGNGITTGSVSTPVTVLSSFQFTQVATGSSHACAIQSSPQKLFCWGLATAGRLGNGVISGVQSTPVEINNGATYIQVAAGGAHTCAIRATTSSLECWGQNVDKQVKAVVASEVPTPTPVDLSNVFSQISLGTSHTCGLDPSLSGSLFCWGRNTSGQLGNGSVVIP